MTGFDSKRRMAQDKEALKLALEALEEAHYKVEHKQDAAKREQAITAIKEVLAQPEQEPHNFCPRCGKRTPDPTTIHTCTPPQQMEPPIKTTGIVENKMRAT